MRVTTALTEGKTLHELRLLCERQGRQLEAARRVVHAFESLDAFTNACASHGARVARQVVRAAVDVWRDAHETGS